KRRNFDKACGMFSNWDMFDALAQVGERERKIVDTVIHEHGLPLSVVTPYKIGHPFFSRLTPLTRERSSRGDTIDMLLHAGALPSLKPIRKGIKFDEICSLIAQRFGTDPRAVT